MTTCVLCRRHLLAGERYRRWEPEPGRGERVVCHHCEREAAQAGWVCCPAQPEREGAAGLAQNVRLVA